MQTEPNDPAYLTLPGEMTSEQQQIFDNWKKMSDADKLDFMQQKIDKDRIINYFQEWLADNGFVIDTAHGGKLQINLEKWFTNDAEDMFHLREIYCKGE